MNSPYVGIDVGAKTVVTSWRAKARTQGTKTFKQTAAGHAQLVKKLLDLQPACVVLEATGVYYFDLAVALSLAHLPVAVINPRSFHHFAQLKLTQSKTDPIDAALLAEYGECLKPALWKAPDAHHLALRDIGRQLNHIVATRTQSKNRLHALSARKDTLKLLLDDEKEAIAMCDKRIARLSQAAMAQIRSSEALVAHYENFIQAVGIAGTSAIPLLGELCVLPHALKATQISRHAGLDIRIVQSGTSVHKTPRISKAGNAYLRNALYMPALSASQHDPRAHAFYMALQGRGKKKMQGLVAIMRKYLTGLWACMREGTPFDSTKLFSEIHLSEA
jgi:transposase